MLSLPLYRAKKGFLDPTQSDSWLYTVPIGQKAQRCRRSPPLFSSEMRAQQQLLTTDLWLLSNQAAV